ncbi:hypothetical protein P9112_005851 [Eukaryota sp. TZLM1-RC]
MRPSNRSRERPHRPRGGRQGRSRGSSKRGSSRLSNSDEFATFFRDSINNGDLQSSINRLIHEDHYSSPLKTILNSSYSLGAVSRRSCLSIQRVAAGFLRLLSKDDCHCISLLPPIQRDTVLNELLNTPFFVNVLHALHSSPNADLTEYAARPEDYTPYSFEELLLLICGIINTILSSIQGSAGRDVLTEWIMNIRQVVGKLERKGLVSSVELISQIEKYVCSFEKMQDTYEETTQNTNLIHQFNSLSIPSNSTINIDPSGPEHYSVNGTPRHDNDKVDYRTIQVLPTNSEVSSVYSECEVPWLPHTMKSPRFEFANQIDCLLDRCFRLYRHELLYPFTLALATITAGLGEDQNQTLPSDSEKDQLKSWFVSQLTKRVSYIKDIQNPGFSDSISLSVMYGVELHTVKADIKMGIMLNISFDFPSNVAAKNRAKWLKDRGDRVYANTQLGIYFDGASLSYFLLSPCKLPQMAPCKRRISLNCTVPQSEYPRLMTCLGSIMGRKQKTSQYLFLVPSVFYPMIFPILNGLQKLNEQSFALPQIIASQDWESLNVPNYLANQQLNISCLFKEGFVTPETCSINDLGTLKEAIPPDSTWLDPTQLDSLIHCLTNNVALIEGFPGTGKSYLGEKLVELLMNQPFCRGMPIMVLCYTNHAADQFLLGLVEQKIVHLMDIVKLGTTTKHDVLKSRLLSTISKDTGRINSKSTVFNLKNKFKRIDSDLEKFISSRQFLLHFSFIKDQLKASNPFASRESILEDSRLGPFFKFIGILQNDDGFLHQGRPQARYKRFISEMVSYIKQNFPTLTRFLPAASLVNFPNSKPCPYYFVKNNCSRDDCHLSHDAEWAQFGQFFCYSWMTKGSCTDSQCPCKAGHLSRFLPQMEFPSTSPTIPCPFHIIKGKCENDERCRWSHDEVWRRFKRFLCFHWILHGNCQKGNQCPQSIGHVPTLSRISVEPVEESDYEVEVPDSELPGLSSDVVESLKFIDNYLDQTNQYLDFYDQPMEVRIAQYLKVRLFLLEKSLKKFQGIFDEVADISHHFSLANFQDDLAHARKAKVIGLTTSVAAKQIELIQAIAPKIVIIEEAGEILEPHLVCALNKSIEHVIMIGDVKQLRPKINIFELKGESGKGYDLDCSTFERLIKANFPFCSLQTQYRMRPTISSLIKPFYPDITITDGPNTLEYPDVSGMVHNLAWFDHDYPEDGDGDAMSRSKTNKFEAEMAVNLAIYLLNHGYSGGRITILTPYLGQLYLILQILRQTNINIVLNEFDSEAVQQLDDEEENQSDQECDQSNPQSNSQSKSTVLTGQSSSHVNIATVDTYQGLQADIIIFSSVRCNDQGSIGFQKFNNRMNVALSRARHGMYIIGNTLTIEKFQAKQLAKGNNNFVFISNVLSIMKSRNLVFNYIETICPIHQMTNQISDQNDWKNVIGGGCQERCNSRLACGHVCKYKCHVSDSSHLNVNCNEPCARLCPRGHACNLKCFENCKCVQPITLSQPNCNHTITVACHASFDEDKLPKCKVRVRITLPFCGHSVDVACHEAQLLLKGEFKNVCTSICGCELECGHKCLSSCGECCSLSKTAIEDNFHIPRIIPRINHPKCQSPCTKLLDCGHECSKQQCHDRRDCPPCESQCKAACIHHQCKEKCKELCVPCIELCGWYCKHQGRCKLPCSSPCNRTPCDLRCSMVLECGCQCPGLCGEACPSSDYCQKCGNKGDVRVDLIEGRSYSEIDLDIDRVIFLSCGHFYTLETLDGLLQFSLFYDTSTSPSGILPFPSQLPDDFNPQCIDCRQPIRGVFRYGRIVNTLDLCKLQKKHFLYVMHHLPKVHSLYQNRFNAFQHNPSFKGLTFLLKLSHFTPRVAKRVESLKRVKEAALSFCQRNSINSNEVFLASELPVIRSEIEMSKLFLKLYSVEVLVCASAKIGNSLSIDETNLKTVLNIICKKFGIQSSEIHEKIAPENFQFVLMNYALQGLDLIFVTFEDLKTLDIMPVKFHHFVKEVCSILLRICTFLQNINFSANVNSILASVEHWFLDNSPCQKFLDDFNDIKRKVITEVDLDEVQSVIKALGYSFDSKRSGFGRFNFCPNGHPYVIGDCGGATQTARCSCGATIGGSGHVLLRDNERGGSAKEFAEKIVARSMGQG